MEKLLPVLFSTAFFNIPRSGALEREKFVERKKEEEKKKWGSDGKEKQSRRCVRSMYSILSSCFPDKRIVDVKTCPISIPRFMIFWTFVLENNVGIFTSSPVFETARNFSWNNLILDDINEYYTGFSWKFHHFMINEIKNKKWVEFYWWNVLNLDFIFLLENRIFFLNLRKEIINCNIFLKLEF